MNHGFISLVNIIFDLIFITLSWWSLRVVKIDLFLSAPESPQGKIFKLIIAVVIGHNLTRWFLDYIGWSLLLPQIL